MENENKNTTAKATIQHPNIRKWFHLLCIPLSSWLSPENESYSQKTYLLLS
jgi:hypothetical protein